MSAQTAGEAARIGRSRRDRWLDPMVLPALAVLAIVVGYPIVDTLVLSTQKLNLLDPAPARFIGASNYAKLVSDSTFWHALANTLVYTTGSVGAAMAIGLSLALLMENARGRAFRAIRVLLVMPWAVPFVVTAFLFRYMYLQNGGVINALLMSTGVMDAAVSWLNVSSLALAAVVLANVWSMTPFFLLLFMAALAGIPQEIIESARVDRAGHWALIARIKLPLLRNALLIGSLLMIIANFNDFAKIWAMTQGGPGYATTTLVVYVYRLAFENFEFGYASAIGVVWLVLLLGFAAAYLRALRAP